MGKSFRQKWCMCGTEIKRKITCVWSRRIFPCARRRSSVFMESAGIPRYFSRSVKAIWNWAGSVIPSPMMQWVHILRLYLPDTWCCRMKAGKQMTSVPWGDTVILYRWNGWYHMDMGISNAAWNVPHHTCRQYRTHWRKDRWAGKCIYEHTSDSTEITPTSSISQKFK